MWLSIVKYTLIRVLQFDLILHIFCFSFKYQYKYTHLLNIDFGHTNCYLKVQIVKYHSYYPV